MAKAEPFVVYVACPWECGIPALPIPVRVSFPRAGKDGNQVMHLDPDLTEVWAHAWTHDAELK